jgi:sugar diacid utilization regulator/GAF domain-containing protein
MVRYVERVGNVSPAESDASVALIATEELYETSLDICGRLDLDQALQAIVRRARSLLGGDVAYLATCDDEHQVLRMRAFDNVRSDKFKALVIPYGIGVGGAVARLRRPQTMDDYLNSDEVTHTEEIDDALREEGLCSGVAAPVEFEARLLAILFVAKRTPHRSTPQQVTLLASLANAAAVAISNAQVHGRLIAAMGIHESLMALALADRGADAVTSTLSELIRGPALLLDWQGTPIAEASFGGQSVRAPALDALRDQRTQSNDSLTIVPIRIGGIVEGFLLASPDQRDAELSGVAIEQTVTVLALELMKLRSAEQVELRLRGGVFTELLNYPPPDEDRLIRQAGQLGCDLRKPQVVAVVRSRPSSTTGSSHSWQRLAQIMSDSVRQAELQVLVVDRGDALAMLILADDVGAAQKAVRRGLDQAGRAGLGPVIAGLSNVAKTLEVYPQAFAEAMRASDAAVHLAGLGGLVRFDELGFHQVLLGARPQADLSSMARRVLEPLLDSDEHRGTQLVTTCAVYLEACGNIEAIARKLALHPNTIRGRVDRIGKLLGRELEDAQTRLDVHLALAALGLGPEPAGRISNAK